MTLPTEAIVLDVPKRASIKRLQNDKAYPIGETGNDESVLVTPVGLRIPPKLAYETWERAGRRLAQIVDSSAWCLADWLVYGQARYTDRYRRAIEAARLDYQTLRNYAWVARSFELYRRRPGLSFQHHAEVASLSPVKQDFWLDRAEKHGWSRNQLRQSVRGLTGDKSALGSAGTLLRVRANPERIELWQIAAERTGASLESWILTQLDAAAAAANQTAVGLA